MHLCKTCIVAAMKYGDEVAGVTEGSLQQRRRLAARAAFPAAYGVCPDGSLAVHDAAGVKPLDPIYDATLGPLKAWLVGAIQAPRRRGMMALAIAVAQRTIHAAARPWGHVAGPAAALLLTLARIGWSVTQPTVFTDRLGTRLDADEHGAFFLCHRARLGVA